MITIIRNDKDNRFAHDVYGIKIKEELPKYKIIGTTRNEGICIYESVNYASIARIFDQIIEAITNGDKTVLIVPPIETTLMTKEEFFDHCSIHDFRAIDEEHPIRRDEDLYGRPIPESNHNVYENPQRYDQDFFAWKTQEQNFSPLQKNSFDNRYLNNVNPFMG